MTDQTTPPDEPRNYWAELSAEKLAEYATIHSSKMSDEGWHKTAMILAECAARLRATPPERG